MFSVALFTVVKIWKQVKNPSTDEWIKKMLYILCVHEHTLEYYSAMTKKEILPFVITQVNL